MQNRNLKPKKNKNIHTKFWSKNKITHPKNKATHKHLKVTNTPKKKKETTKNKHTQTLKSQTHRKKTKHKQHKKTTKQQTFSYAATYSSNWWLPTVCSTTTSLKDSNTHTTNGQRTLNKRWTVNRRWADRKQTLLTDSRRVVDELWTKGGRTVDERWTNFGQKVDERWTNCGQKVDELWIYGWQTVDGQPWWITMDESLVLCLSWHVLIDWIPFFVGNDLLNSKTKEKKGNVNCSLEARNRRIESVNVSSSRSNRKQKGFNEARNKCLP